MSARIDCQCGALRSLLFDTVTIERIEKTELGRPADHLTEIHVPAGHPARRCLRFVRGLATRDEDLLAQYVWNSTPIEPDKTAGCDVSTEGEPVRAAAATVPS